MFLHREVGSSLAVSFLLTLLLRRHFKFSSLGTMCPIFLPSTWHGLNWNTVSIDKILTGKFTYTCVPETTHSSLVIWIATQFSYLVFLPLLGRNHTDINQMNATVWYDGIECERNKIPLWPPAKMAFCDVTIKARHCHTRSLAHLESIPFVMCVFSMQEKF